MILDTVMERGLFQGVDGSIKFVDGGNAMYFFMDGEAKENGFQRLMRTFSKKGMASQPEDKVLAHSSGSSGPDIMVSTYENVDVIENNDQKSGSKSTPPRTNSPANRSKSATQDSPNQRSISPTRQRPVSPSSKSKYNQWRDRLGIRSLGKK